MKKTHLWMIFLTGFGLFMFTRSSVLVPTIQIMIAIAPIFILRFSRSLPVKKGILLTLLGFILSMNIALWGLFELEDATMMMTLSVVRSTLLAILYFIPFMLDRILYEKYREHGEINIIIFPVAITAVMFLASLEGPFDGMVGKTIYEMGNLQFKQLASVFGLWGFIFFYSWLDAIVVHIWEGGFKWQAAKKNNIAFVVACVLILGFGHVKVNSTFDKDMDTVKIAAIVLLPDDGNAKNMMSLYTNKTTDNISEILGEIDKLITKVTNNKAQLVTFQENSAMINEEDIDDFENGLQAIAKKNQVFLNVTYGYYGSVGKGENIQILIDPKGEIVIDYTKRYLLGLGDMGETSVFKKGKAILKTYETPFGVIGTVTCRDMDFESFIKQASDMNVDILLGPSYDYPESKGPYYTLRAIENGFTFIRATYNGTSFAEDYHGRILAEMDFDSTQDGILYADVPQKGIKTVYGSIGNLFGWMTVVSLLMLMILSKFIRKPDHKAVNLLKEIS